MSSQGSASAKVGRVRLTQGPCNGWDATSFTVSALPSIIWTSPSKLVANYSAIKHTLDRLTSPTLRPQYRHVGPSLKSLWHKASQVAVYQTTTVLALAST